MSFFNYGGIKYQKTKLASQADLYFLKTPGKKVFYIKVLVKCGSMFENLQNSGVSHLLEHLMFRGNKRLGKASQLNFKLESLPGDVNAFTSLESTEFWYSFELANYKQGIKNFCDFLFYPSFHSFEKEKKVVLEEIKGDYNYDFTQNINVLDITNALLWPDQSIGMPIAGSPKTIKNLSKKTLINYYKSHYQPKQMVFSVLADEKLSHITKLLDDNIPQLKHQSLPKAKKFKLLTKAKDSITWVNTDLPQLDLIWAFSLDNLNITETMLAEIFCGLLDDGFNSRLPKYLREESALVYDVEASLFRHQKSVVMMIRAQISVDNVLKFVKRLSELLIEVSKKGFSYEELAHQVKRENARLNCLSDFQQTALNEIIEADLYKHLPFNRYSKLLRDVKLAKVNKLANKFLSFSKDVMVISGPRSEDNYKKLSDLYKKFLADKL